MHNKQFYFYSMDYIVKIQIVIVYLIYNIVLVSFISKYFIVLVVTVQDVQMLKKRNLWYIILWGI